MWKLGITLWPIKRRSTGVRQEACRPARFPQGQFLREQSLLEQAHRERFRLAQCLPERCHRGRFHQGQCLPEQCHRAPFRRAEYPLTECYQAP